MKFLYVGQGFYVNADQIEIVQKFNTRVATREKQRALVENSFYDASGSKPTRTLLTLRSGWVVASPNTPDALVSRPVIFPPTRPSARKSKANEEAERLRLMLENGMIEIEGDIEDEEFANETERADA